MLQRLFLENLILVDSSELHFSKGFTVITGETGSGKSILLTAINLLLGEKADTTAIRHGEKLGIIEADFLLPKTESLSTLFDEFSLEKNDLCTVRRELLASGKSRATVDGCAVPINFLKRLGSELIEISGQHAYLSLQEENAPQMLLDTFAGLEKDTTQIKSLVATYKRLETELQKLLQEEALRSLEIERILSQIQEIDMSKIFDIDDASLFLRLKELEDAKELFELTSTMIEELESGKDPLVRRMHRLLQKAHSVKNLSPRFTACYELIEGASSSLREAEQEIHSSLDQIEFSEAEHAAIETCLKKIDQIKRKYGSSPDELKKAYSALKERLSILEAREEVIETLKKEIAQCKECCVKKAAFLHEERCRAIPAFEKSVYSYLALLRMPQALFQVVVEETTLHQTGTDKIRFFLTPNIGEKRIEVKDGASGGEMARLFLAIQATMAHLTSIPTIIFDEIDASIGGVTASSVGELLSAIGNERQVFAITHFTQVASHAKAHMALYKETLEERTLTKIRHLSSKKERADEHNRMIGKK